MKSKAASGHVREEIDEKRGEKQKSQKLKSRTFFNTPVSAFTPSSLNEAVTVLWNESEYENSTSANTFLAGSCRSIGH